MTAPSPMAMAIFRACDPSPSPLPVACDGAGHQCLGEILPGEVITLDRDEFCGPCALKYAAEELSAWADPGFTPGPLGTRRAQDALDAISIALARVAARVGR